MAVNRPPGQTAMRPPAPRTRPGFGIRTARRGWALVRAIVLVALTGFLIAAVLATIFAGLVIAISGKLP